MKNQIPEKPLMTLIGLDYFGKWFWSHGIPHLKWSVSWICDAMNLTTILAQSAPYYYEFSPVHRT